MIENKKVLIIGDVILDVWTYAKAVGLSLETPTLKAQLTEKKHTFGGAGNVVKNLYELGAQTTFLTLLGDDDTLNIYEQLNSKWVENFIPIIEKNRKNIVKERYWIERGGSTYKHLQINTIDNEAIKSDSITKAMSKLDEVLKENFDVILLIDYRHGLFTGEFLKTILPKLKKTKIPIMVNSQISDYGRGLKSNHKRFKGVDLIVMNKLEAEHHLDRQYEMESDLPGFFDSNICVTSGRGGSTIYFSFDESYHQDVIDIEEVDPYGAGDSFISALSLTNWKDYPEQSLFISNCWAGLSVQNHGTVCPNFDELKPYLEKLV